MFENCQYWKFVNISDVGLLSPDRPKSETLMYYIYFCLLSFEFKFQFYTKTFLLIMYIVLYFEFLLFYNYVKFVTATFCSKTVNLVWK